MHLSSPKHHAVSHGVRGRQCQHPQTTQCSVRRLSTRRQVAAQQGTPAAAAAQQLVEAAAGQQFGASSTAQQQQTLLRLVSDLKQHQQQAPTTGPLQGDWQLLWTSEASVHGIVRGLVPVADITQCIDLKKQRVTNTIAFGWLSLQLQASGPLKVLSASRIFYSFDQLRLSVAGLQLPLPVFFKGGGWTDCVLLLLDAEGGGGLLRVMENSRRDTLVLVQRH